jgi:hypothetical protein
MQPSNKPTAGWKIITNCSSIKRRKDPPINPDLRSRTLESLCSAWIRKVNSSSTLESVKSTYGGRTFIEATNASEQLNADLYVISAGLGLVHADDKIPNYNMTISNGSGSIANWLLEKRHLPKDWWAMLNSTIGKTLPILRLIEESEGMIFALPSTYLEMIKVEIEMIGDNYLNRVFIITSPAGQKLFNHPLKERCLTYDERLNGAPGYEGTRNDFPQRALRHFVKEIDFKSSPINVIQSNIRSFIESNSRPLLPARARMSDQEIKKIIYKKWEEYGGRRENLLRYLRDKALISCEQKRFGHLWNEVKLEII